jgi:hypothetical protein
MKRYGCVGKQLRAVHHCLTQITHSVTSLIHMAAVEVQETELYCIWIARKKEHKQNANHKQTTNSCTTNKHWITKMYTQTMEIIISIFTGNKSGAQSAFNYLLVQHFRLTGLTIARTMWTWLKRLGKYGNWVSTSWTSGSRLNRVDEIVDVL